MGIANGKATMFFQQGDYGWSETHYCASPNPVDLQALLNECVANLCPLRARLLGKGAQLSGVRCSYHQVWRDSLAENFAAFKPSLNPAKLSPFGALNAADNPYYVTTVRINMTPFYRKLLYASGMPAVCQPAVPLSSYPADFQIDFNHYFDYLTGDFQFKGIRWGALCKTKETSIVPTSNIVSITQNGGDAAAFTVTPTVFPAGLRVGQQVRILGSKMRGGQGRNPLNGVFGVTGLVGNIPNAFTIKTAKPFTGTSVDCSAAYLWVIDQQVQAYTDWAWENQTEKKRGLVSGQPRGRSVIH